MNLEELEDSGRSIFLQEIRNNSETKRRRKIRNWVTNILRGAFTTISSFLFRNALKNIN